MAQLAWCRKKGFGHGSGGSLSRWRAMQLAGWDVSSLVFRGQGKVRFPALICSFNKCFVNVYGPNGQAAVGQEGVYRKKGQESCGATVGQWGALGRVRLEPAWGQSTSV